MPRKRRIPKRRGPMDFAAIVPTERMQWSIGGPFIKGEYEPTAPAISVEKGPSLPSTIWASWGEWAATYARCRDEFLAKRAEHRPLPDAELLYQAIQRGDDPREVRSQLSRERYANDPRRVLYA